jgi:hypothetical protein
VDEAMKFAAGLLIAALPCALAAQLASGMGYTMTTTIDSGGRKHTSSIQTEVLGSKMRIAMKSDFTAATPVEFFQLWDSTAATITQVMPSASMAMIMPSSLISSAGMTHPALSVEIDSGPKSEIVDLGAGEKILGFATRHYRQTLAYTMKITIGGETCRKPTRAVSEFWTTSEVKLPDLSGAMQRFTGGAGMGVSASFTSTLDSLRKQGIHGTVLRTIGTATSIGAAGDSLRVTTTTEISAIHPDSVDAHDFEVPAGYNVMDMRDTMASMDLGALEQSMFAAQLNISDRLKKSMCGGAGTR